MGRRWCDCGTKPRCSRQGLAGVVSHPVRNSRVASQCQAMFRLSPVWLSSRGSRRQAVVRVLRGRRALRPLSQKPINVNGPVGQGSCPGSRVRCERLDCRHRHVRPQVGVPESSNHTCLRFPGRLPGDRGMAVARAAKRVRLGEDDPEPEDSKAGKEGTNVEPGGFGCRFLQCSLLPSVTSLGRGSEGDFARRDHSQARKSRAVGELAPPPGKR
jgi:hypothetical protein